VCVGARYRTWVPTGVQDSTVLRAAAALVGVSICRDDIRIRDVQLRLSAWAVGKVFLACVITAVSEGEQKGGTEDLACTCAGGGCGRY
jgi:hypothetical protein